MGTSVRNTLWCSPHSTLWIKLSVERKWLSDSHKKANVEGITDALSHLQNICTVYNVSCNVWSHVSTPLWRKLKIRSEAHWCEKSHWVKVENRSHWKTVEKCFPWIFCDTIEWVTGLLWKMSDTIFSSRSQMAKTFRLCLFSHKQQSAFLHSALRDSVNLQYVSWIYDVRRNKATQPVQQWMCISQTVTCTHICLARDEKWKLVVCRTAIGHATLLAVIYPDYGSQTQLWLQVAPFTAPVGLHSPGGARQRIHSFKDYIYIWKNTSLRSSAAQCVFYVQDNRVALIF